MLYLVIGRTASGKTHFADLLEKNGLRRVVSRTTRPRRPEEDEDAYVFIEKSELDDYPERLTETEIDGNTYFTTRGDLRGKDFYVIDPIGAKRLAESLPDETIICLYLYVNEPEDRKRKFLQRSETATADDYASRNNSEDMQFTEFERQIIESDDMSALDMPDNVRGFRVIVNDYRPQTLEQEARDAAANMRAIRRLGNLVKDAADHGIMTEDSDGRILTKSKDGDSYRPPEDVACMLLSSPTDMTQFIAAIMAESDLMSVLD